MASDAARYFVIRDVICEPEIVLIIDPHKGGEGYRNSRIGTTRRRRLLGNNHVLEFVCNLQDGSTITVPAAFVVPIEKATVQGNTGPLTIIQ